MRPTTKIVLGMIIAAFVFTFVLIIYAKITYKPMLTADQDNLKFTSIEIPEYKTLIFKVDTDSSNRVEDKIGFGGNRNIYINSTESPKNQAYIPHNDYGRKDKMVLRQVMKPFVHHSLSNDTLTVYIKRNDELTKMCLEGMMHYNISLADIHLFTDSSTSLNVQSYYPRIDIHVDNMNSNKMNINTVHGSIKIANCTTDTITTSFFAPSYNTLVINDCKIVDLYIQNNDPNFRLFTNNSKIETGNFWGLSNITPNIAPQTFNKINFIDEKEAQLVFP